MHSDTSLEDIELALANKYLSLELTSELEYMRVQGELLLTIKQDIEKKKNFSNDISFSGIGSSLLSNQEQYCHVGDGIGFLSSFSVLDEPKSKFTQDLENSSISSALKEVQTNCSEETSELVKQYLTNMKIREVENLEKMSSKLILERDELASQILILKMEKANTEKELEKYKKLVGGIEEEKKNIKKRVDYVLKKENQVFKLQASFAFKEKVNLELKKRYERLVGSYLANEAKIEKMYEELDKLWSQISLKIETVSCGGVDCWKKDAMYKAKDQLIAERKLIKEESTHLEKEYEVMSIVSEQFKKIFQEPEKVSLYHEKTQPLAAESEEKATNLGL